LNNSLKQKENTKNHCVVGDFNVDTLGQDIINLEFLNNFLVKCYRLYFLDITRPSENVNHGTCIDNFFIRTETFNINSFKLTQVLTDHYPLFINTENFEPKIKSKANNNTINYNYLKDIARSKNWSNLMNVKDPNITIESMISEIQVCINLATSSKVNKNNTSSKRRKAWITKSIINSLKTKETLYKLWKANPNNESLKKDFKKYEKKF
jgi:hypothetical protein